MSASRILLLLVFVVGGGMSATRAQSDRGPGADDAKMAALSGGQLTKFVEVRVVDPDGNPIAGVTVTPWALRSSQGHGWWTDKEDDPADLAPRPVTTGENGVAKIAYPFYRNASEKTRTFQVSLRFSHSKFSRRESVHVDVPATDDDQTTVEMRPSASLEITPRLSDSDSTDLDRVFPLIPGQFSGPGKPDIQRTDGKLVVSGLGDGEGDLIAVRIQDGVATHFSDRIAFELKPGERTSIDVTLSPSVTLHGRVDDSIPRPVKDGRLSVMSSPDPSNADSATWHDWTEIDANGEFVIKSWPAKLPIQIIGLCDGYVLASGDPPSGYSSDYDASSDPFQRPQVVTPDNFGDELVLPMEPLVPARVHVVDLDDNPVPNVSVASWPNVGWWNWGSQVYAQPLVRSVDAVMADDISAYYDDALENTPYASLFDGRTDENGRVTLQIPAGREAIGVYDENYTLPVILGRRVERFVFEQGQPLDITLRVVPTGTDLLGDYDKLAGVVFGCSTREGKRICALPEVREKMDEFVRRLKEAKDPRDPTVLCEAYAVVAEAFEKAGDPAEAAKWRDRSAAERVRRDEPLE